MGQISLLDGLDWRPGSRLDSDRLRSLPASRDPVEEDVERRVRALEAEARALVRSIDWAGGRDAGRPHRPGHGQWVRPHLLRCIGGAMLVVRAPHLTNRRRQRLLDAFDACFAWERANVDA